MNTIRSIVSMNTYRIPPRLRLFATRLGSLILLFQRMPVVQFLFPEANIIGGASVVNTVSLAVTTVVGLGVFDSVSGQSQISERAPLVVLGKTPSGTSPAGTTAINVPATVSAPLTFSFNWDPNNSFSSVKSWRCTTGGVVGTLPAGLGPALVPAPSPAIAVGGLITISGTPTALPGIYPVTVNVYRSATYGSSTAAQIFNICVLGFSTQPAATTTINSGASTTLNCVAAGNPLAIPIVGSGPPAAQAGGTLTYEWYQGTTGTIGAILGTSSSFATPLLTASTSYWVRLKSVLGTSTVYANSTTATVNVNSAYTSWASVLPVGQNGPLQTPQNDGVSNLQKFAFNMNPTAPDVGQLTVGAGGTSGLPGGAVVGGKLRIEYLRRKASSNPGITYMPQFTSTLGVWVDFSGTETIGTAPAPFERVTVEDTIGGPARFGRVKVVQSP